MGRSIRLATSVTQAGLQLGARDWLSGALAPSASRSAAAVLAAAIVGAGCARPVGPLPDVPQPSPTPAPPVVLPRDAGVHDALTEWWYFTGHLRSDGDGRLYGFEFTIFQVTRQGAPTGYLAHFAVSDVGGQRFSHQARSAQVGAAGGPPSPAANPQSGGVTSHEPSPGASREASQAAAPGSLAPDVVGSSLSGDAAAGLIASDLQAAPDAAATPTARAVTSQEPSPRASREASQAAAPGSLALDVGGWTLSQDAAATLIAAEMQAAPGAEPPVGLRLRLVDDKAPALHNGGYIDYGSAGGSYYYSRTRLSVQGQLSQAGEPAVSVSGVAWMDHQWGNFVVAAVGGWDWYSLQLDDRTELMLYVLRAPNGEISAVYGTQVLADGTTRDLGPGSVRAEATGTWTSPHTGAVYPAGWRLTLPGGDRLELQPQLADQELYFPGSGASPASAAAAPDSPASPAEAAPRAGASVGAYWEGAVSVGGDRTGVGYVELTGYAAR